jgi:predicted kinase
MPSKIIIVSGFPASGKTTISQELAKRLDLPLISADRIKERLSDQLGCSDHKWSMKLSRTAYDLIYLFIETVLKAKGSLIVEGYLKPEKATPKFLALKEKYGFDAFQVVCQAAIQVRLARFKERWETGLRHRGHFDDARYENGQFKDGAYAGKAEPLGVPGKTIEVDSTNFDQVSVDEIIKKLGL